MRPTGFDPTLFDLDECIADIALPKLHDFGPRGTAVAPGHEHSVGLAALTSVGKPITLPTLSGHIEGLLVHHEGTYTLRSADDFSTIPGVFVDSNTPEAQGPIKQALRDGGLYVVTVEYPIGKRTVFAAHATSLNGVPGYPSNQSK